ncbi:MAG: putative NRPS-like protein biosynthetic cluster [Sarcosagium campestre]|nr:MAG: putative NRPS-like protein biosynthetic cluster [Sarcosagium campestre]
MAEENPELQSKLQQLDHELEEGDITEKGYQKRRTLLLSQYLGASSLQQGQRGLRVHNAEDSVHLSQDGSRAASLAALDPHSGVDPQQAPAFTMTTSPAPATPYSGGATSGLPSFVSSVDGPSYPHGDHYNTYHGQDTGPESAPRRQNTYPRDSLFLPGGETYPAQLGQTASREPTMTSNYAFNPNERGDHGDQDGNGYGAQQDDPSRQSTMMESQQNYFSDFAGQQRDSYGGGLHRYSNSDAFSPTAAMAPPMLNASDLPSGGAIRHQMPLEPRDITFPVFDPHDANVPMSKFDNLAAVLRHRSKTTPRQPAYWVLDPKGKEILSITWEKFGSRAEKVAQVIRDKSNLYRGDRVALIYRDAEVIDFAVALLGCFIAGVVGVPINHFDDYQKLNVILLSTQAHLALTTDNNLKAFQREITMKKLNWPRGVEWWKTNEFGSFHPKRKDEVPPLIVPDLAYIEFSRAPTGDLRGVVMSHRTIIHQMTCLSAIISTVPGSRSASESILRDKNGKPISSGGTYETILSYLDPRQSIGMILGVLLTVYGGHTTVWMDPRGMDTAGLYAHLVTKYKATLMVGDYPGLKRAAFNYQTDPMATRNFKKNFEPNFKSVKLCLMETLTVDSDFHEILADRWLRPLRNERAREVIAPMLCLPEHGGMIISIRDWLGGEERMGCPLKLDLDDDGDGDDGDGKADKPRGGNNGYSSLINSGPTAPSEQRSRVELGEVLLDKEALKTNEVVVVASGKEARERAGSEPGTVRVGAFGYPIPDATLAVVDPETSLLCSPHVVGEVWVDSPSLSGGFWALPKHTETIFHARPYRFEQGNPNPMPVEPEFLRTGLLGTVIEGKLYVLGLYEDRLRQKVEWVEHGMEVAEYRYFFVQHLIVTIMKNVTRIYDCSAFDVFVNEEHLPIVLLESPEASTSPLTSGGPPRQLDSAMLDSLAEKCMESLYQEHHVRVYCVMITAPNTLPRVQKNGRQEIGNMLCRREFDQGSLQCVHVKFGVERAVLNLPVGIDPVGGIWSPMSAQARQDILMMHDKQYSGVDYREVVIDDRTSTPLNNFSSIVDLLQWRVARQAEELSYCSVDGRGREGKGITWKKLDTKIASVAMYLKNKAKLRPSDHVILMYTHSEEYVCAVHACFCLGLVAIPIAPLDQNRLHEDAPAYLHMIQEFGVKAVLVNAEVDHLLKSKPVAQHLKQSALVLKVTVPNTYNTAKPPKQSTGCRDLGLTMKPEWIQPSWPVLIWTYWTPDQRRISVQLGHDTIMGTCKVQKETCQMTSSRPVLGCVRSTIGLGFVHTCLMGVFVGAPTYLVSPVDFAQNPASLFLTLSRYKIKDTYATSQMLDHAMNMMPGKGFNLQELKNLMISTEGRPRVDVFQKVRLHFAATGLDRTAINTIYSHALNPMVASRSYMCIEPIELWLEPRSLRKGLVVTVDPNALPDGQSDALLVQDSGMVPVSTQIAIVNPESCRLCHIGEYGEIWVQSEACVKSFYGSRDAFDAERFNGRTVDGDPAMTYVRTGDLGFLHTVHRPIGPQGTQVEMQILFVLGAIGETFEINGLSHFPMDIEFSVERCHRNIVPGGCAVFQAGGLVVVLVEVTRKAYLGSIVPVIVNAVLNEHQLVIDIVAFVPRGDFPRSRLGEKQRGKILASWVTRKMNTMAQFAIRDFDGADSQITEVAEPSSRNRTTGNGSLVTSSLRHVENLGSPPASKTVVQPQQDYAPLPTGISEMPAMYDASSIQESPSNEDVPATQDDDTPTNARNHHFELPDNTYDRADATMQGPTELSAPLYENDTQQYMELDAGSVVIPADHEPGEKSSKRPPIHLPSVTGRESLRDGDLWTLPSQNRAGQRPTSAAAAAAMEGETEEEWPQEAIMHMNLAGDQGGRPPRSPGYHAL